MPNKSKNNKKKVSIIVPTHNRGKLIRETIDSFLNQTYKNFEIIIVDDGSTDNTAKVIQPYLKNKKISFFSIEHQGHPAPVRNYGIKKATGEFIAFCDDDDLWYSKKLQKQINEFEKDKNIGLVFTNRENFTTNKDIKLPNKYGQFINDLSFKTLLRYNSITCSSVCVRKNVLEDVGLFDEHRELVAGEDWELWLRIAKKYKLKFINEPLVKYRYHPGVLRKEKSELIKLEKKIYDSLLKKDVIDKKTYNQVTRLLKYKKLRFKIYAGKNIGFTDIITILKAEVVFNKKMQLIAKYVLTKLK